MTFPKSRKVDVALIVARSCEGTSVGKDGLDWREDSALNGLALEENSAEVSSLDLKPKLEMGLEGE